MGKLIAIAGSNGSGKTTLAASLALHPGYTAFLESHTDRPFQIMFAQDVRRYALPNQLDYLLRRAEQEREIRASAGVGVQDGGLDQDFHLYTRLFHHKGFLNESEFNLCRRIWEALRDSLPAPDLIVWLRAPISLLRERLQARARTLDLQQIVTLDDLPLLDQYLEAWLGEDQAANVLPVDITTQDPEFSQAVRAITARMTG
jgi:deoxyadenosine/deoxycytidine kinase